VVQRHSPVEAHAGAVPCARADHEAMYKYNRLSDCGWRSRGGSRSL